MKIATITPVYNEEDMLPQFIRHYAPQVDAMFILDNESTDRTAQIAAANPKAILSRYSSGGKFNDRIMHEAILRAKAICRGRFDYVLLVDCDEFVIAKSGRNLRAELESLPPREAYRTHGYWMAQHLKEPPYDPSRPLFEQRQWGAEDLDGGSKSCIVRPESTRQLCYGIHKFLDPPDYPEMKDPKLSKFVMLHYIAVEESIYIKRRLEGRIRRMSEENRKHGFSSHYFSGDENTIHHDYNGRRHYSGLHKVLPWPYTSQ